MNSTHVVASPGLVHPALLVLGHGRRRRRGSPSCGALPPGFPFHLDRQDVLLSSPLLSSPLLKEGHHISRVDWIGLVCKEENDASRIASRLRCWWGFSSTGGSQ
jgi:hypothetical protein